MPHRNIRFLITVTLILLISPYKIGAAGKSPNNNYKYNPGTNSFFPQLPAAIISENDLNSSTTKCHKDGSVYLKNLANFTLWAWEMYNSNAQTPVGLLSGNIYHFGHFDQCLNTIDGPFPVQYCLVGITASSTIDNRDDPFSLHYDPYGSVLAKLNVQDPSQILRNTVKMGWCVPASCSVSELEMWLNDYFIASTDDPFQNQYNISYSARLDPLLCQQQHTVIIGEVPGINIADIMFCVLTLIVVCVVVLSTIWHVCFMHEEWDDNTINSRLRVTIECFSAKSNWLTLTKPSSNNETNKPIKILYGIRTLSMLVIIFSHRIVFTGASPISNYNRIENFYRSIVIGFISRGDLCVDIFFVLSGLLLSYNLIGNKDKTGHAPWIIILIRYVRLTPLYAYVIFFYATVFQRFGNGPLWRATIETDTQDCRDNWWTNLLYINNYVNSEHMCLVHSWYLPCDFHFTIIGVGLCLLIKKSQKIGLIALFSMIAASVMIPYFITIVYRRTAMVIEYPEFLNAIKSNLNNEMIYNKSHARASTYFVGFFAGYLYHHLKEHKFVTRVLSYTIILVSLSIILVIVGSTVIFFDPYHTYNAIESATYAALNRPLFAISSVAIFMAISYNEDRTLYNVLTWRPVIPLSKLIYGAYLVHELVQFRTLAQAMHSEHLDLFNVGMLAVSDAVLTFLLALVLYLVVEAPCQNLFIKHLLLRKKSSAIVNKHDQA